MLNSWQVDLTSSCSVGRGNLGAASAPALHLLLHIFKAGTVRSAFRGASGSLCSSNEAKTGDLYQSSDSHGSVGIRVLEEQQGAYGPT